MVWSEFPTFTAGEALLPKRRVKVESGTTTDPVEVVYADGTVKKRAVRWNSESSEPPEADILKQIRGPGI